MCMYYILPVFAKYIFIIYITNDQKIVKYFMLSKFKEG